MKDKADRSLTPEEVAQILKITRNTVYEMVKRGELPAYRIGRKIRIDPQDVEIYKQQGKRIEGFSTPSDLLTIDKYGKSGREIRGMLDEPVVICGQDILLDILTRYLEKHSAGILSWRNYVGSFEGLYALYNDEAHMTAAHLWDGDNGQYNVSYVRHLLPGIPIILVHLAKRMQGFYVQKGNPKNITTWSDLVRPDVKFINREKGSGTRVLLDEQFRVQGLNRLDINGYQQEELSHLAVASVVARGDADVGLGNQKASLQVRDIDFIPMHEESYDLVMKKEDWDQSWFQAVLDIVQSNEFQEELRGLGDYNLSATGTITEV